MLQVEAIHVDYSNIATVPMSFVGNTATDQSISFDDTLKRILEPELRATEYDIARSNQGSSAFDESSSRSGVSSDSVADYAYRSEENGTDVGSDQYSYRTAPDESDRTGQPGHAVADETAVNNGYAHPETTDRNNTDLDDDAVKMADKSPRTMRKGSAPVTEDEVTHERAQKRSAKETASRTKRGNRLGTKVEQSEIKNVLQEGRQKNSNGIFGSSESADLRGQYPATGIQVSKSTAQGRQDPRSKIATQKSTESIIPAHMNTGHPANASLKLGTQSDKPASRSHGLPAADEMLADTDTSRGRKLELRHGPGRDNGKNPTDLLRMTDTNTEETGVFRLAETKLEVDESSNRHRGSDSTSTRSRTTVIDLREAVEVMSAKEATESNMADNGSRGGADMEGDTLGFGETRSIGTVKVGSTIGSRVDDPGSFSRMFRETMNPEIVRQSTFVLKGNQQGEIRLNLRPEHLGNVRVRLEIVENRITGRIIVDSALVRETVEQNLDDLARAFREQGYESASLDVSVSGNGENRAGERELADQAAARRAIKEIEETVPAMEAGYHSIVNVIV